MQEKQGRCLFLVMAGDPGVARDDAPVNGNLEEIVVRRRSAPENLFFRECDRHYGVSGQAPIEPDSERYTAVAEVNTALRGSHPRDR